MATLSIPRQRLRLEDVPLTNVERGLISSRLPILDPVSVEKYKDSAHRKVLATFIGTPILVGVAVLISCLWIMSPLRSHLWGAVGVSLVTLVLTFFGTCVSFLANCADLFWASTPWTQFYQPVPPQVADVWSTLTAHGVDEHEIYVEHLQNDPILYVLDHETGKRYDLIIW